MTEQQQKSRVDTLIGIFRALLKFDPLVALIAILIIAPVAIPIVQAILSGDTLAVITFVVFIGGVTTFVYIPLIIVKTRQESEKALAETRQKAIETEAKNRLLIAESKQKQLDELVTARISTLTAERDFILGKSYLEDRKVFLETMEQLHELLKNSDVNFVSQSTFTETFQKVLEDLSVVYQKIDAIESSSVDGPQPIKQEFPETTEIQDLKQSLFDWKANYESLENTLNDSRGRYQKATETIELKDIQLKSMKQERNSLTDEVYTQKAHLAEVRDLIGQYRNAYGELPEPTKDVWDTGEPDVIPMQKSADDSIPSKLPEPFGTDDFSEGTEKKDNFIISTVKKVIDKVSPDKSVLTEAMDVLDGLKDETAETELTFDEEALLKPIRELPAKPSLIDPTTPKPKFWECPKCKRGNDMKKVRCPKCGTSKPL